MVTGMVHLTGRPGDVSFPRAPHDQNGGAMDRESPTRARFEVRRRASARLAGGRSLGWAALDHARDARVVGGVLGVLAALGLTGAALTFVVDIFVAPWRIYTSDVEESLHLLASVIGLAGAVNLSRYGLRTVVLAGLALNVAATVAFSRGSLGRLETLVPMLVWLLLAAATILARVPRPEAA
jgi:hypothetical protein